MILIVQNAHRIPAGRVAPDILKALAESRSESGLCARPLSWTELKERISFRGSSGTFAKTIKPLIDAGLVRKADWQYEITFEGRWALFKGPAVPPPPLDQDTKRLIEIHGYLEPTPTQLEFLGRRDLLNPKKNVCIFASPDQGKTLLAEVCALKALRVGRRVLYLTPYKAVNREKHELFDEVFGCRLGYAVKRVDGDTPTAERELERAHIVLATYERAHTDFIMRRRWIRRMKLVVADEVTLLGDRWRGPGIDLFLTSMCRERRVQIVTLASHVGNEDSLVRWLSGLKFSSRHARPKQEYIAAVSDRCVTLERAGEPREDLPLNGLNWRQAVLSHLREKGTVLFLLYRRRMVENAALLLSRSFGKLAAKVAPPPFVEETDLTRRLMERVGRGFAFHHAGVPREFRRIVEEEIRSGNLKVVTATSTVRYGADLPFGAVVLYLDHRPELGRFEYEEYIGRAGASGAAAPTVVYLVTREPDKARRLLTIGLEDIWPQTLGPRLDESVEKAILSAMLREPRLREGVLRTNVAGLLRATAACVCSRAVPRLGPAVRKKLGELVRAGILLAEGGEIRLTDRGRLLAELGLGSEEETRIRRELERLRDRRWSDRRLLKVAYGVARGFGDRASAKNVRVLLEWIDETPLERIVSTFATPDIRHDTDVVRLANDAAEGLDAISQISRDMGLAEVASRADTLVARLRHGVREDLLETDLLTMKNMNRAAARRLYGAGYRSVFHIYDATPPARPSDPGAIAGETGLPGAEVALIQMEVWGKRKNRKWVESYNKWKRNRG